MADGRDTRSRDSIGNTFIVAIGVSLVCSVLVASTAVLLKPEQEKNRTLFRQQIVLEVAGIYEPGADIAALFEGVETRLVELDSGEYVDSPEAESFDALAAANDPELGVAIPPELDTAVIRRRARFAPIYVLHDGTTIEQVILPVYGAGLWSTMYGYLALEGDGNTVRGLQFYEHAETPGLGDQIDRADWRAQWPGKQLFDADGNLRIEVVRGQVPPGGDVLHQVDGLSGATLTGRGVSDLLQYWTGPHGFGPYLERLRREASGDD